MKTTPRLRSLDVAASCRPSGPRLDDVRRSPLAVRDDDDWLVSQESTPLLSSPVDPASPRVAPLDGPLAPRGPRPTLLGSCTRAPEPMARVPWPTPRDPGPTPRAPGSTSLAESTTRGARSVPPHDPRNLRSPGLLGVLGPFTTGHDGFSLKESKQKGCGEPKQSQRLSSSFALTLGFDWTSRDETFLYTREAERNVYLGADAPRWTSSVGLECLHQTPSLWT